MTTLYGPFQTGAGSSIGEDFWNLFAQHFLHTGVIRGVLSELATFGDSTGMQVKVPAGAAWVVGQLFYADATTTLAVGAANGSNPRIDRVVVRRDSSAKTLTLLVLAGTAAASPSPPALVRTTTVYDLPLAQVLVPAAATTVSSANVTDERPFTANLDLESVQDARNKTFTNTVLNGTVSGTAVGTGSNQVAPGTHTHGFSGLSPEALLGFFPGTTVTYAYTGSPPVLLSETFSGSSQLAGWSRTYAYDGSGRVQTMTLKQGATTIRTTTYTYNGDGTIATEVHV